MTAPIWSISPDWSQPLTERLEWLTDVLQSTSGSEQRRALRRTPRRTLEFTVTAIGRERALFDFLVFGSGALDWQLPVWHDRGRLTADVAANGTTLALDTASREIVAGGGLLLRKDAFTYELATVQTVADGYLTLAAPLAGAWPAGTLVVPTMLGRLTAQPQGTRKGDQALVASVAFQAAQANPWPGTPPSLQYLGYPVLTTPPDEREDITAAYDRILKQLDNSVSVPFQADTAGRGFTLQQYRWWAYGLDQHAQLRGLLYALRGRLVPVWLPTFFSDLVPVAPLSATDTALKVQLCGLTLTGGPRPGRQDILIRCRDGSYVTRRLTGSALADDGTEVVGLDSAIPGGLALDDMRRVSFMLLARQDQDSIEITHQTDSAGLTTAVTTFRHTSETRNGTDWAPAPLTGTQSDTPCVVGDPVPPPPPPPVPYVRARVVYSDGISFSAAEFPASIAGTDYGAGAAGLVFDAGALFSYTGFSPTGTLAIELMVYDRNTGAVLDSSYQPAAWTVTSANAQSDAAKAASDWASYGYAPSVPYAGAVLTYAPLAADEHVTATATLTDGTTLSFDFYYRFVQVSGTGGGTFSVEYFTAAADGTPFAAPQADASGATPPSFRLKKTDGTIGANMDMVPFTGLTELQGLYNPVRENVNWSVDLNYTARVTANAGSQVSLDGNTWAATVDLKLKKTVKFYEDRLGTTYATTDDYPLTLDDSGTIYTRNADGSNQAAATVGDAQTSSATIANLLLRYGYLTGTDALAAGFGSHDSLLIGGVSANPGITASSSGSNSNGSWTWANTTTTAKDTDPVSSTGKGDTAAAAFAGLSIITSEVAHNSGSGNSSGSGTCAHLTNPATVSIESSLKLVKASGPSFANGGLADAVLAPFDNATDGMAVAGGVAYVINGTVTDSGSYTPGDGTGPMALPVTYNSDGVLGAAVSNGVCGDAPNQAYMVTFTTKTLNVLQLPGVGSVIWGRVNDWSVLT